MDDWDVLREQIYSNLNLKSSEQLQRILQERDLEEWSEVAFEVARQILLERKETFPESPDDTRNAEVPLDWKTVDWNRVYAKGRKMVRSSGTGSFFLALLLFALFIVFALNVLPSNAHPIEEIGTMLLLILGFGWLTWMGVKSLKTDVLVFKAKVYLKTDLGFFRKYTKDIQLVVHKAFKVTSIGELEAAESWLGHRDFVVMNKMWEQWNERQEISILVLSSGGILGELKDYTELRPHR